ncbi:hypothetical protein GCM10023194_07520 [Planotetraspora phitsanulokensis]|uniref:Uncharacterized protein n=1 Tax=Planotetraspora phitsanulokensis TaxID=575192 RepID=A0A8J3U616_9ACTN|nr:hypothetical protein Pph01_42510 [Planotetraspora phitsanulokensis]
MFVDITVITGEIASAVYFEDELPEWHEGPVHRPPRGQIDELKAATETDSTATASGRTRPRIRSTSDAGTRDSGMSRRSVTFDATVDCIIAVALIIPHQCERAFEKCREDGRGLTLAGSHPTTAAPWGYDSECFG